MKTLSTYFGRDSHYRGECGSWLVCATLNRDADCLSRSNYRCFVQALGGKGTEGAKGNEDISDSVAIEEASHWACGWIQYLIVDPACLESVKTAEEILERLDNYPVLDDEDFCALEMEEANDIWRDYYRPKERLEYIREHRSQFDFRGFADLLAVARGKYFSGYASELLN